MSTESPDPDSIQSRGGRARADKLTPEERRKIAQGAARARWQAMGDAQDIPQATHIGELRIGDTEFQCGVLQDGTRLLAERHVAAALGRTRSGSHWQKMREQDRPQLPLYLTADNLAPFINPEVEKALGERVLYRLPHLGGRPLYGINAGALPAVCDVWLRAREAGALTKRQLGIAQKAEVLMRGLAHVGIIALVDEATGYQEIRQRSALEAILNRYLQDELRRWTKTFPDDYFHNIFRLKGWKYPEVPTARPGVIAHYTNDIVYSRIAPGILDALQKRNPTDGHGRRKHKHFQHMSDEHGDPRLREHLNAVIVLMRASTSWDQFYMLLQRAMPKFQSTRELMLTDETGKPL